MAEEQNNGDVNESQKLDRLPFHYIKSNFFRVVHADGAFGGVTPRLDIHMAIYNERNPIPKQTVNKVTQENRLGDEIVEDRIVRDGIVREVEVDLIMDLGTAKAIVKWLNERIEMIEKASGGSESEVESL